MLYIYVIYVCVYIYIYICIYIYIYIYIDKNIFWFVEWSAECCCRHVDKCSGYSCRITYSLLKKVWTTTKLY